MIMKILLVNPPTENMLTTEVPTIVEEERGYNPPLGLMYIAAYIEKNTEHIVDILDTEVDEIGYDRLEHEIKKRRPDVVGITTMTFTLIDAILTAKIVKGIDGDIKVIFGGPHVNIYPRETIGIPEIDFLVMGEGEILFTDLIQNIDNKDKLDGIGGLVFKDSEQVIVTGSRELIKDLDSLPFPARHLTSYKKYYSLLAKRSPITTMITSRGCPYNCLFCNRAWLGKIFRARSAGNVVDEMEECIDLGINEFLIYDDTFTINRKRVIDICADIKERGLDIGWDIRARVDTVDKELLRTMKKSGCERIHYGVESGNQEILNVLRKGITLEQVDWAFELTKKEGISTLAYFMIGSPRETRETILQSINFAKKIDPDFVHFSITTPFPSTDLYKMGLEEGILKNDYWREFAKNPTKDFIPELWIENLTKEKLIELLTLAYKSFYIRPSYVIKRMLRIKSLEELKRKANAGLSVFKM